METEGDSQKIREKCPNPLIRPGCSDDFQCTKMLFCSDGMNIEIRNLLFILIKKIEADIIISSVSHEEVNPF
jgi:hypothetical protein